MIEMLSYEFMQRAIVAGMLIAISLPVIGAFLVARRYSLIADGMAHMSLAGVGAGLLFGATPTLFALPATIVGGLLLEYLRQKRRLSGETGIAILMSGGLAIAVVLSGLSSGSRSDFNSYLFGSITTTSYTDLILLTLAVAGLMLYVVRYYASLLHIVFDEDSARVNGLHVTLHNYVLVAWSAVMVALSVRIVGGLLISALLVIPVVASGQLSHSFRGTVWIGIVLALCSVLIGLALSYVLGIAAGGAIVLTSLVILVATLLYKK